MGNDTTKQPVEPKPSKPLVKPATRPLKPGQQQIND